MTQKKLTTKRRIIHNGPMSYVYILRERGFPPSWPSKQSTWWMPSYRNFSFFHSRWEEHPGKWITARSARSAAQTLGLIEYGYANTVDVCPFILLTEATK